MKTLTATATATQTKKEQKINLIDGIFTASETADILRGMIDQKINFHKIHRLCITEGNQDDSCSYDNGRIAELMQEKEKLNAFIKQVREQGGALQIKGNIEITLLEQ
jgi:uncharacterized protein with FMN-binding domain